MAINRKNLTFLDDLKRLTQSLVSRTALSSVGMLTSRPDKEPLVPLSDVPSEQRDSGGMLPTATAISQGHTTGLGPHAAATSENRFMEHTSTLPAPLDPPSTSLQPASTSRTIDSVPVVANTPVELEPHSTAPVHPTCPIVADLPPSAFAEATSHPFNTEIATCDPHRAPTVLPSHAPHDTHMTFLSDVELDVTDTVGAPVRDSSPHTRLLKSHAAASDLDAQSLQSIPPAANLAQCTPAAVVIPSKRCSSLTWGSAAPAHAGSGVETTSDVVTSLIASGMDLFTPPPLQLEAPQPDPVAMQPLQQIQVPTTSSLPSSGAFPGLVAPSEPSQPVYNSSAASAAPHDTFVEPLAAPGGPQLPRGDHGSPLLTARTPRPQFAAPVVAHRDASGGAPKPLEDRQVQNVAARHGNAPPVLSCSLASDARSSCATHAMHAVPSALPLPPSFGQEGCDGSRIRAQHNAHATRIAHGTPVATGPLQPEVPVNDALAKAIMLTSDNSVLSCASGSMHAHTPSYKRPGCVQTCESVWQFPPLLAQMW